MERRRSDYTVGQQRKLRHWSRQANTVRFDEHIDPGDGRTHHLLATGHGTTDGFSSSEAVRCPSHQLLRTTFPQALPEIAATLARQKTWSGVLIHRHADGRAIMTVNHWYVHQDIGNQAGLVTEVHYNITQVGKIASHQLANALAALAHEFSEPLTAVSNYVDGTQRFLQRGWPDLENVRKAMAQASDQIARSAEGVRLLRDLVIAVRGNE